MPKINLMYVLDDLRLGGPTIFVTTLKHLDKSKYNISVCCLFGGGELVSDVEKTGIKIYVLGLRKWKPWLIFKLAWLMRKSHIHIVHTHLFGSNTIGRIAAILSGIPVIIATLHDLAGNRPKLERCMERILSYFTHQVISVSEAVKSSFIKQAKIHPYKIGTIHNSIDLQQFNLTKVKPIEKRQELGFLLDSFIVGRVARLTEDKGHRYLIEAIPLVLKEFPDTKFVLVGRGPLKEVLEKQVQNAGISNNVVFLGLRDDIPELTAMFDLVVLPSLSEGLPSVLLEAMALKKAVVATPVAGIPEVVLDGITGILVPPRDSSALARAIIKLLKDKELREKMGQQGYERVKNYFNYPRMIKELDAMYNQLIKERLIHK